MTERSLPLRGGEMPCLESIEPRILLAALPALAVSDAVVNETAGTAQLTITMSAAATTPVTVKYSTVNVTAVGGRDYVTQLNQLVTFAPGETSNDIQVQILDDAVYENNETFAVALSAPVGATLADARGIVTIVDDELPLVSIKTIVASVAENSAGVARVMVTRQLPATTPLVVNLTAGGDATPGADYVAIPASVTIPARVASVYVNVRPINDTELENRAESVTVSLAAGSYIVNPALSSSAVSILDDEKPIISVAATDNQAAENPLDTGTFTFTRSGRTGEALTVYYSITGTALNGVDYVRLATNVTFQAGQSTAQAQVTPIDDVLLEGPQTATVTLLANRSYVVDPSQKAGTVTIIDNERPLVSITATDAAASETPGQLGQFKVARVGNLASPVVVNLTISGTADNGVDYAALPTQVTIPAYQTQVLLSVAPVNDGDVEGSETVILTLADGSDYFAGASTSATVTIADNDIPMASSPRAVVPVPTINALYTMGVTGTVTAGPTLNGVPTVKIELLRNGSLMQSLYVSADADGLWLHRVESPTSAGVQVEDYSPASLLLPSTLAVGQPYYWSRTATACVPDYSPDTYTMTYSGWTKVLGNETVVAAGQTFNTMKVQIFTKYNDYGGTIIETTTTYWLAPVVGIVKSTVATNADTPSGKTSSTLTYVLSSYTLS